MHFLVIKGCKMCSLQLKTTHLVTRAREGRGIGSPGGHLLPSRTRSPVWGSWLQEARWPAGPPVGGHVQLPGVQLGAPYCRPAVSGSAGAAPGGGV